MKSPVCFFLAPILLLTACQVDQPASSSIIGAWQGVNDQGRTVRVEFSPDGRYRLSVEGSPLTYNLADAADVKYELVRHRKFLQIQLFDESDELLLGNLRVQFPAENQLELQLLSDSNTSDFQDSLLLRRR